MRGTRRSIAWDYFQKIENKKVLCNLCDREYKNFGNTTNLLVHLKNAHKLDPTGAPIDVPVKARLDVEFKMRLAQAVQQRPHLYDPDVEASKEYLKQLWEEIGAECGDTDKVCRKTWQLIRKSFTDKFRKAEEGRPFEVPSYMSAMDFLVPYITLASDQIILKENNKEESDDVADIADAHPDDDDSNDPDFEPEAKPMYQYTTLRKMENADDQNEPYEFVEPKRIRRSASEDEKPQVSIEYDSRKHFLLSLAADLNTMSEPQMRKFRRKVLDLIDEVLNSDCLDA